MSDYHTKRAKEIIQKITYATVATTNSDGQPWNTPVYYNPDENLNIYWVSDKKGQHSRNIKENGRVFIVIYDSTIPEGEGEGVYIQAVATQVTDPEEILRVRRIKKGSHFEQSPDEFLGGSIRYMYKAVPEKVWMNDAEINDDVFIRDYRVEINIDQLIQSFGS
jgi:general stress protein 26